MSSHLDALRERRLALVASCDQDRTDVAQAFGGIQRELHVADRVIAVAQGIKANRVVMGAVAAGLVLAPVFARKWIRRAAWWLPVAIQGYKIIRQSSQHKKRERRRSDSASAAE
jgi:hypothetical protein